jgi:hypothetical protein
VMLACACRRRLAAAVVLLAATLFATGCAAGTSPSTSSPSASSSTPPAAGPSPSAAAPSPAPVLPAAAAIAATERWLRGRQGVTAIAIIDPHGRLHGYGLQRPADSASLVKAMLLVQFLRAHKSLTTSWRFSLARMIVASDEASTDRVYAAVGSRGLAELARDAGMKHFVPAGVWALSQVTAADQARFFLIAERLVPRSRRAYADKLLSERGRYRGWGIPQAALLRGWRVFWKDGWIHSPTGELLLQAARLERGGARWSVAVIADGQPTSQYGVQTMRGVGVRLVPGAEGAP